MSRRSRAFERRRNEMLHMRRNISDLWLKFRVKKGRRLKLMRGRRNGGRRERSKKAAKNVRLWSLWIEKIEIPLLAPSLKCFCKIFTCVSNCFASMVFVEPCDTVLLHTGRVLSNDEEYLSMDQFSG
jgi:hypothetical protein